ncbi:S8 family serine peptidase [Xanthomonas campestris pv. badrii]|uniref:S8 family serine peptidase n=1 Tax=Xanthomonas campestris pv. badrii TaxID=149696 RepID=A0A7Z2ZID0_XANCA|nr:S8 family serine peptidase [Xanthomonas campestris]QJD68982.1 S8 family serine peptidase [Xanthomonas campestris pv. badrii]
MNNASLPLKSLLLSAILATATFQAHAANDQLSLRSLPTAGTPTTLPTRLIVKYHNSVPSDGSRLSILSAAATRAGVTRASDAARATPLNARVLRRTGTGASLLDVTRTLSSADRDKLLAELRADPQVQYAEFDRMLRPVDDFAGPALTAGTSAVTPQATAAAVTPNDRLYAGFQWHLQDSTGGIRVPQAWETSTGAGVVVAVLDTGILPDHPDLKDNDHILPGYDFISNATMSRRDSDARVPGALDYGDWTEEGNFCGLPAQSSSWHGTHTAGTVGELTNNTIGGAGVAHDAQILPVRVLGQCGGTGSDIADAIVWASGGHVDGVPDNIHPAEVISLSLGGPGTCDSNTQSAIDTAVANGAVVVVVAGNEASNSSLFSPSSCGNVINVGATRITGGIAFYSNFGSSVDLAGPGGGASDDTGNNGWDGVVLSTGYSGTTTPTSGDYEYVGMAGTSMATPHVAAVAALVQSALAASGKTPLAPAQMEAMLRQTARAFPVRPPAGRAIGTGIVDATAALEYVRNSCSGSTCTPVTVSLTNRVALTGQSGGQSEEKTYRFAAAAGSALNVLSYGGGGNVGLYIGFEAEPSTSSYLLKSVRTGSAQTLRLTAPQTGTYYIKLIGGAGGFNNVSLMARQ